MLLITEHSCVTVFACMCLKQEKRLSYLRVIEGKKRYENTCKNAMLPTPPFNLKKNGMGIVEKLCEMEK